MSIKKLEFKVDNRSTVPKDIQIATLIKKNIVNQTLEEKYIEKPLSFAKEYDLNIDIVNNAFKILINENVFRVNDEGKYYNAYEQRLFFVGDGISSIDFIKSIEMEPTVKILSRKKLIVNEKLSEKTFFPIGISIISEERLFYGNDTPIIYAIVYYRANDEVLFVDHYKSMKSLLSTKYDNLKNDRDIKSITVPNNVNKILNQPLKTIGTFIEENISSNNVMLYFGEFYYNRYHSIRIDF